MSLKRVSGVAENHNKRVGNLFNKKSLAFSNQKATKIMKKKKSVFMAIAILAVVSGALAFRPTFGSRVCFTSPDPVTNTCQTQAGADVTCATGPIFKDITTPGTTACYEIVPASTNCSTIKCPFLADLSTE
jgi:hypothetical protein